MGFLDNIKIAVAHGEPTLYYAGREIKIGRETAELIHRELKAAIDSNATRLVDVGDMALLIGPTIPTALYLPPPPDQAPRMGALG